MATTQSTPGHVEFLIKKYPGGKFSGLLDGGIAVGDELALTGPYGSFTLKDGHVLPVVCVAGGAGMAPILSMLRHMSETASTRPVRFYYGARTAADLFYLDEIARTRKGFDGLRVRGLPVGIAGRADARTRSTVEEGNVTDVVARHEADIARTEVYLCGPPPMVDAALALARGQRGAQGSDLLRQVHQPDLRLSPRPIAAQQNRKDRNVRTRKAAQLPEDRVHRLRGRRAGVPELARAASTPTTSRPSCAPRCTRTSPSTCSPTRNGT